MKTENQYFWHADRKLLHSVLWRSISATHFGRLGHNCWKLILIEYYSGGSPVAHTASPTPTETDVPPGGGGQLKVPPGVLHLHYHEKNRTIYASQNNMAELRLSIGYCVYTWQSSGVGLNVVGNPLYSICHLEHTALVWKYIYSRQMMR